MHTRDSAVPRVALKVVEFARACEAKGLHSATACGEFLGVRHTTVSRVKKGRVEPSSMFIAATLLAFPGHTFEDFFEVLGPDQCMHARATRKGA